MQNAEAMRRKRGKQKGQEKQLTTDPLFFVTSLVCAYVFFLFILDIEFVGRTSRLTQEEGHTGFLIHLLSAVRAFIFLARMIQLFLSLVDREVDFCVLTI